MKILMIALAFILSSPVAATAWSPPSIIDPGAFGAPTFRDDFDMLDAGPDMTAKSASHRWRTVTTHCYDWTVAAAAVHDCRRLSANTQELFGDGSIGLDPFRAANGIAYIDVKPLPPALARRWGRGYLSGWLSTKFSFAQRYGYFEARLALPEGKGFWPAFWLMPTSGQWPAGGEIDIMEALGVDGEIYASVHAKPGGKVLHDTKAIKATGTMTRYFRTFGVAWTAREIVWYLDRREIRRIATPTDVHLPMHPILNVATGGSWAGPMKVKSGRMAIDYVSVWQIPD